MIIKLLVFAFLLVLSAGCNVNVIEEVDPTEETLEGQLQEVMKMPLSEPEGALARVVVYGGDSDKIHATTDIYYPITSDVSYRVLKDKYGDSVAISLNYCHKYHKGKIEAAHLFNFDNSPRPEWQSTNEYAYNEDGKLMGLYYSGVNRPRYLLADYIYDPQGRLTQVEYAADSSGGVELLVYTYDEQNRVKSEWKTEKGYEEMNKIDYMEYKYDEDGVLVAKVTGERGGEFGTRQDRFRYFYNQKGKDSVTYEFDPYFGHQQVYRTEFFYH